MSIKDKFHSISTRSRHWSLNRAWFPHVPLAATTAVIGFLHLVPLIEQSLGWDFVTSLSREIHREIIDSSLWGIPQSAVGVILMTMSLGLLRRSRIAWVICVLIVVTGLLLQLNTEEKQVHWWWILFECVLLLMLLPAYRHFDRDKITVGLLFAFVSLLVFTCYAVFGVYRLGDQFDPPITDLTSALYFIVVTVTSVGYGDITPATLEAQVFLISVIILGVIVAGSAVGATLVPAFMRNIEKITSRRHALMKRTNHYIIVGRSALAGNTYLQLVERGEPVTFIMDRIPDNPKYADIDVVTGDGSDVDILKEAGGEEAKAILALLDDDSENAVVVLAAKELAGNAQTVATVNDVKNLNRIRRVDPSIIIAPQVLCSELLTMTLTGEEVDSSRIMLRLLGQVDRVSEQ